MAEPKPIGKEHKYDQFLPRHDHLIQWNLYSLMTGIDEGIIFYINKNNQQYIICETERNESIISTTLEKFKQVQELTNNIIRQLGTITVVANCTSAKIPDIKFSDLEWNILQEHLDLNI